MPISERVGTTIVLYRFIPPLDEANIHYEYIQGRVCLHFEEDTVSRYRELIDFLMQSTENDEMFEWGEWNEGWLRCKYLQNVETTEQLDAALEIVMSFFDKLVKITKSIRTYPHWSLCHTQMMSAIGSGA